MSTVKDSYADLVGIMKELGAILGPATAVQYEAPPVGKLVSSGSVRNPTLDIVADPRRSALSDEISATSAALRQARAILAPHAPALRQAVARWEGQEGRTE